MRIVSLYDNAGNNILAGDDQRKLRHAVAGCLELLPHCMPIFAPNHNAYRRYGAMVNAASKASWGFEDRDACIRIPESDPATCASNTASLGPMPTRTWCWRPS